MRCGRRQALVLPILDVLGRAANHVSVSEGTSREGLNDGSGVQKNDRKKVPMHLANVRVDKEGKHEMEMLTTRLY